MKREPCLWGEYLQTYAVHIAHISNDVKDSDERSFHTWTVSAMLIYFISLVVLIFWKVIVLREID